jgi:hypothetical protein
LYNDDPAQPHATALRWQSLIDLVLIDVGFALLCPDMVMLDVGDSIHTR